MGLRRRDYSRLQLVRGDNVGAVDADVCFSTESSRGLVVGAGPIRSNEVLKETVVAVRDGCARQA